MCMKKVLLSLMAFGFLANNIVCADTVSKPVVSTSVKMIYIKEADVYKTEIGKYLKKTFEAFESKMKNEDAKIKEKLNADFAKLSKNAPDYAKKVQALQERLEAHGKKMQTLQSKAMAEMQRVVDEVTSVYIEAFKIISKKYGKEAIMKAENVFAYIDENSKEYLDVTVEFIKTVNQKKTTIQINLPMIN